MSSIQKQLFLLFDKRKQSLFVDHLTYQRIRSQVFSYPKKYQNGYTYYIDLDNDLYEIYIDNHEPIIHNKINNYEEWLDRVGNELGDKKHKKINETQRKIIHLLNDFSIDRISMAGIMGTLEQENLNENTFLNFIENKVSLTIEDCTDQIWRMRGY